MSPTFQRTYWIIESMMYVLFVMASTATWVYYQINLMFKSPATKRSRLPNRKVGESNGSNDCKNRSQVGGPLDTLFAVPVGVITETKVQV